MNRKSRLVVSLFVFCLTFSTQADIKAWSLVRQLADIRGRVIVLEQGLLSGLQSQKNTHSQMVRLQHLLKLQKMERELGQKRLSELGHTVEELESRRVFLKEKLIAQQKVIYKSLIAIEASNRGETAQKFQSLHLPEQEKLEAPRRKVLSILVDRGIKEIEILHADLADATQLEARIQDEKQQLTYLFQDLKEQEGVLELNRQLRMDILRKKQSERVAQLKSYRNLKSAEAQVEHLISEFNARIELENTVETEKKASRAMNEGMFSKSKGKLSFPVANGKVIAPFGRSFDPKSGLYVFKKGIDILAKKNQPVRAISAGKVAYSGELPNYGQVVIIDHGEHYYSLCAHLGAISKKSNESVAEGDRIGVTGDAEGPLYFEIRARNVAVNPLQWVFN